ncbi:hypothetical protein CBR_g18670 [Chara braunii]|uniref:Reverse transcriptase domain-containing protein n=1 Tax=Chara braunii TaxID=69332 RepID=A0A388JTE9_CHABU|nr:hypothetical protein CBR_g18670 [Chara braunii]|eukprot:GBG61078.1 hypothetical protein CBR_g18670 [Chara braunii]
MSEECDRRDRKIEEAELRTIAAVSRDLRNLRAEIRTEIQMALAVNARTPKRDREAFVNGLDTYLTEEEVFTDDGANVPPKKARGKQIARNYAAPDDWEEEARVMSRADYEKSLGRKTSTSVKNNSVGKEYPASGGNGSLVNNILDIRSRLMAKEWREVKKLCEARDITYVSKEQGVRELLNRAAWGEDVEQLDETYEGKGYLRQLLEMPFKRKELSLLSVDKLMHLCNCAGSFKEKEKRKTIRDFLGKVVGRKAEVNIRKRMTVKIRYSKEVRKSGIRNILITKIGSCGLHPAIAGIVRRKSRILWRRNRHVAEILCNHKQHSRMSELLCTCKHYDLPAVKGHVLARIGDIPGLSALVRNGKNVVRPKIETTKEEISSGLRSGLASVLNGKLGEQLSDLQIADCFSAERDQHCSVDEGIVLAVKNKFRDLIVTQVDRNAGDLVLMCPSTYQHGLDKLFAWNVANDEVSRSEAVIMKEMKTDFENQGLHKLVNWNPKGREHTTTGSRWIARALNFLLEKLPGVMHFNLTATARLEQNLKKAETKLQQYGKDTLTTSGGFNIKEMFTSLPHSTIMGALNWLLGEWEKKGFLKITVCKRRKQVTLGRKAYGKGYVKFSFTYIRSFISFKLQHTYTKCRGKMLKQVIGVPMGKNSSPPLTCILCAKYEESFLRSLGSDRKLVHGVSFMDDAMLAVVCNRRKESSVGMAREILRKFGSCYGKKLSLVCTDDGSNTIDFVGSKLTIVPKRTQFLLEPKIKNRLEVRMGEVQQRLVHRCFQDFNSYSDKRAKIGAIIGCLHHIQQMANSESTLVLPVLALKYELLRLGYPPAFFFFFKALARFAKGTNVLKEPWIRLLENLVLWKDSTRQKPEKGNQL